MSELALKLIRECKETRSTWLDLSNCGLTELPDELFELVWLEELYLCANGGSIVLMSHYPKSFKSLNNGELNKIRHIPPEIARLKNLSKLDLSDIPIISLPKEIIELNRLLQCDKLRLTLSEEKHQAVRNQKYELAANKRDAEIKAGGLYLNRKYIKFPPVEICNGLESICNYIKQIEKQNGIIELYEAKLIIVGEGATGKTTLFEKLKDKNYQIGNSSETHGINIHEGLPFKHTHIGENIFNANLWDFGGQELQYMTHQFFLTPRALYVLMMDARRESPNLAYWFKIISLLGRDSEDSTEKVQLLLVFNKRGNTTGAPPQYQEQLKYYADSLDVQYVELDLADNGNDWSSLRNKIETSLVTLPIVKSQLPRLWKEVREDLREEAKTECHITTKRFSEICSKHGIIEEADQWLLSGYLHQLGSLLHFQNDKGLRRLVILSPQWAVDGVYTFLSEESIARNNGRFTEVEFMALLATKGYNRDDADVILQLMTKNNFDICYEATEHNYVAAQLLPDNAPQYQWFPKEVLQFRYQYPIMPKGLMSRLIVRLSDDIERDAASSEQIVWKKGVVLHIKLKEGECRVRLREDDAESKAGLRQILIDVMGERDARKYALRKVRTTVDDLHKKWFRSIKADEMVPCCCEKCKISDNPKLYPLDELLELKQESELKQCTTGKMIPIQQLLEGVYDKNEINNMDNQRGF
jgi:internalin A